MSEKDKNKMLKNGYKTPELMSGYDQLSAFFYEDGSIALDFVNHTRRDFASEEHEIELDWPWEDGYKPTAKDWESIGFAVITA